MPSASLRIITADYLKTMRIPIRRGLLHDRRHRDGSRSRGHQRASCGAVLCRGGSDRTTDSGERGTLASRAQRAETIVGVVGNVKYGGLDEETPAEIYLPYDQHPVEAFTMAVRTRGDAVTLIRWLRREVAALDPVLPLADINSLEDLVDGSIAGRRLTLLVFLVFGAIAVVLSAVGVYGVLAYLVGQRTREIGLRLAIGASRVDVAWLLVREGAVLILVGMSAGLAGALAGGRWIGRCSSVYAGRPGDLRGRGVHALPDRGVNVPACATGGERRSRRGFEGGLDATEAVTLRRTAPHNGRGLTLVVIRNSGSLTASPPVGINRVRSGIRSGAARGCHTDPGRARRDPLAAAAGRIYRQRHALRWRRRRRRRRHRRGSRSS